jgi:hypothetical protein
MSVTETVHTLCGFSGVRFVSQKAPGGSHYPDRRICAPRTGQGEPPGVAHQTKLLNAALEQPMSDMDPLWMVFYRGSTRNSAVFAAGVIILSRF